MRSRMQPHNSIPSLPVYPPLYNFAGLERSIPLKKMRYIVVLILPCVDNLHVIQKAGIPNLPPSLREEASPVKHNLLSISRNNFRLKLPHVRVLPEKSFSHTKTYAWQVLHPPTYSAEKTPFSSA